MELLPIERHVQRHRARVRHIGKLRHGYVIQRRRDAEQALGRHRLVRRRYEHGAEATHVVLREAAREASEERDGRVAFKRAARGVEKERPRLTEVGKGQASQIVILTILGDPEGGNVRVRVARVSAVLHLGQRRRHATCQAPCHIKGGGRLPTQMRLGPRRMQFRRRESEKAATAV